MASTVFPAAATTAAAGDRHPVWCACRTCTDRLVASVSRPLVPASPGDRRAAGTFDAHAEMACALTQPEKES